MVLIRPLLIIALAFMAILHVSAPAHAHEKKLHAQTAQGQASVPPPGMTPGAVHERMEEHMEDMEKAAPKTFSARLMSWFGRTHPFAVHFPIALFPVALVALVLARRRGEAVELIRALVIVAGAGAVVAAGLGWLSAGFVLVDTDPVQTWHRWIGSSLAALGGLVALWAWRRRASVNSGGMVAVLAAITLGLLVQGWLGAALVHGMNHMAF